MRKLIALFILLSMNTLFAQYSLDSVQQTEEKPEYSEKLKKSIQTFALQNIIELGGNLGFSYSTTNVSQMSGSTNSNVTTIALNPEIDYYALDGFHLGPKVSPGVSSLLKQ